MAAVVALISDHRYCRLLRPPRERPHDCRAAECDQQFPTFDGDTHTPSRARCVNGTIPRHERAVFTLACWNSRAAIADAPILLLLRASPPARLSLMPSQISARNGATRLAPPHAKYPPDRKRAWLGSTIATGFRRL